MRKAMRWTRGERIFHWSIFTGVLALTVLTLWFSLRRESGPADLEPGADLSVPLAQLKPGKLFLFSYRIDPAVTTQIAVQKGSDGIIRAAFAACPACAGSKAYAWFGHLNCGRCRGAMKMPDPTTDLNAKRGGCDPPPLAYSIVGNKLVVSGEAIEAEYARQFKHLSLGRTTISGILPEPVA